MRNLVIILSLIFFSFFIDTITVFNESIEFVEMKKRHTQPFASQSKPRYLPNTKVNIELEKYNKQFSNEDDKYKL